MPKPLCSVIVILLNEEENLPTLYDRLVEVAAKESALEWEFVFVDDGSTDRSFAILRSFHERDSRVCVVRLSRNFGAHEATTCGMRSAAGDAAVIMSADLQDPPPVIHDLLARWREGNHIVWAVRRSRVDPLGKRVLSKLYYAMIRMSGFNLHPAQGTGSFFLISRPALDAYNRLGERNRVTFELIAWLGYDQALVPYERPERYRGHTKFSFGKLIKTAIDSFFAVTQFPVRIISYVGCLIALGGILWGLYIVFSWYSTGGQVIGWASLMVSLLFIGGVLLISIGILGEYAWRILDEVRARPSYVVMQALGRDASAPYLPAGNGSRAQDEIKSS